MNKKLDKRDAQRARRADSGVEGAVPESEAAAAGPEGYDEQPTGAELENTEATPSGAEGETAQELVQSVVDAEAEASEWLHDEPGLDVLAAGDEPGDVPASAPHPVVVAEEPLPEATPAEAAAEAADRAEILEGLDANEVPAVDVVAPSDADVFLDDGEDLDGDDLEDLDSLLAEVDGSLPADTTVGELTDIANEANEDELGLGDTGDSVDDDGSADDTPAG